MHPAVRELRPLLAPDGADLDGSVVDAEVAVGLLVEVRRLTGERDQSFGDCAWVTDKRARVGDVDAVYPEGRTVGDGWVRVQVLRDPTDVRHAPRATDQRPVLRLRRHHRGGRNGWPPFQVGC